MKRIDKFELYITHAQKHDFFHGIHTNLYEVMSDLRKLRNRVHIQNEKNHFEQDDAKAFNEDRLIEAEKVFEAALRTMSSEYLRDPKYKHVDDFELPWSEHWPDGQW